MVNTTCIAVYAELVLMEKKALVVNTILASPLAMLVLRKEKSPDCQYNSPPGGSPKAREALQRHERLLSKLN